MYFTYCKNYPFINYFHFHAGENSKSSKIHNSWLMLNFAKVILFYFLRRVSISQST